MGYIFSSFPNSALSTMSEMEMEDFLDGGDCCAAVTSTDLSVWYHACFGESIDSSSDFPGSGFLESGKLKCCVAISGGHPRL